MFLSEVIILVHKIMVISTCMQQGHRNGGGGGGAKGFTTYYCVCVFVCVRQTE